MKTASTNLFDTAFLSTNRRVNKNNMKANAQTGENQSLRRRDARHSSRRLCLSWLATLLLATSGTATAATVQVDVGGASPVFDPSDVTIQPGDTVEWTWASDIHSVTSGSNGTSNGLFDSGSHKYPFTFSYTFQNAGTFPYFCIVHYSCCNMVGSVTVAQATSPTPTPTPASGSQLLNISTRMRVLTGDNVLIGGFIVTGTDDKKVIIRGLGPSLTSQGVPGALQDPTLELHDGSGALLAFDDNWKDTQQAEIEATGIAPSNDLESAIVATLPANNSAYTAILRGKDNTTGVGLVEVYDLAQSANSQLANISTRGFVDTGNNVMIGGFILGNGSGTANVIVRALGPSLGISGELADPTLELHDANGALIMSNDNWKDTQQSQIEATGIPPQNDLESAIVVTIAPAAYTAIVAGKNGTTGIGLVEVYRLP
jgi:plastocyanin